MALTINGRVVGAPDGEASFSRVEAWSASGRRRKPLASTVADAQGAFHIDFDEAQLDELAPVLGEGVLFRVLRGDEPVAETGASPVWRPERAGEEVAVPIPQGDPVETHRLAGRLTDAEGGRPVGGLVVRAAVQRDGKREELGTALTDDDGRFTLVWPAEAGRTVHLEILSRSGDVLHEVDKRARDAGSVAEIRVPLPDEAGSDALADIAATSGLRIPKRVVSRLASRGITTVGDLLEADLEDLVPEAGARAMRALRGLTALSGLSTRDDENATLVKLGYDSPAAIATTPRETFVGDAGESLGDLRAGAVHAEAVTQDAFLNTIVAGERASASYADAGTPLANRVGLKLKCSCEDCEAGVSPGAYLAELLRYSIEHVTDDGNAITLKWLGEHFHQPFRDLPASCHSTEEPVRQVRICIEVMRAHLTSVWSTIPQERRDALVRAEATYRLAAYEQLLVALGTSYEEVRLARTADDEARQALAGRLGLSLETPRPDALDRLLLEGTTLTEAMLEQRFGLKSTTAANLLAATPDGELRDWRANRLRSDWRASDWPTDPWTDENTQPERPVVDPDLLFGRDFRPPFATNPAYNRWQARTTWMGNRLSQLDDERKQNGLDAAMGLLFGTPLPDLDSLLDDITNGTDPAATQQQLEALNLTPEAFGRLMDIRAKDIDTNDAPTDAEWAELNSILGQADKRKQFPAWIQQEHATDVALGQQQFWLPLEDYTPPQWRGTAQDRAAWAEALRRRSQPPVIDPDLIGPADLRDPVPGDRAYDIWTQRRAWVDATVSSFIQRPRSRTSFDTSLRNTLGITQAPLDRLIEERRRRIDVAGELSRLTLDAGALDYLMRIRDLIDSGGQITDGEWAGVSSVLTQVLKRRRYSAWRRQERVAKLLIGPDEFRLVTDPLAVPELPRWLGSMAARRNWIDLLEARVEQMGSVGDAAAAAVDAAEEFALPFLRDALLAASDAPGTDLPERAKWLSDRLLVDTQTAACTKTTRVAQAIETMQQLLFQLRTDQLRDTYRDLALNADRFDEEWEWLGSYATWRAAMFILFYPEVLLIPTLRRQQTPAFRALVSSLRANKRLTAAQTRQVAREHAAYFRDICSLHLEASCSAGTRIARTGLPSADYRGHFYVFARAGSGHIYWSRHNFLDNSGYAHSFWAKIDAFDGVEVYDVIGAFADAAGDDRWLWLFARVHEDDQEKLMVTRLSLEQGGEWKELEELGLPDGVRVWQAIMVQSDAPRPRLAILSTESGQQKFYLRQVSGADWADDDWTPISLRRANTPVNDAPDELLSAVGIYGDWGICVFALYGGSAEALFVYARSSPPQLVRNWSLGAVTKWQGAFALGDNPGPDWNAGDPGTARIYAFWHDGFATRYRNFGWPRTHNITAVVQSTNSFLDAAASNMAVPDGAGREPKPIAFSRQDTGGAPGLFVAQINRYGTESVLYETNRRSIAPQFPVPPDILEIEERMRDPQLRLGLFGWMLPTIEFRFGHAANKVPANRTYLEEAFYLVPVQLALQLQQRGEYTEALDWFRTVYDYGSPLFDSYGTPLDERKIYYGLREEEQYGFDFTRAADWLLDPLNPHAIAGTRRNSYTRFTLLSIIRCLLEFGDSEFTQDTAETVPRARALYTTALELLAIPELDQTVGMCDRIIGQIDIEVGGPEWQEVIVKLKSMLSQLEDVQLVEATVKKVNAALTGRGSWDKRLAKARAIAEDARASVPEPPPIGAALEEHAELEHAWRGAVLREPALASTVSAVGAAAAIDFETTTLSLAGPVLSRNGGPRMYEAHTNGGGRETATASFAFTGTKKEFAYLAGEFGTLGGRFVPAPVYSYCVPPNPLLRTLRLWAELNLFKLRNCRNIAGLERELELYAAPTDTETGLPSIGAGGQLTLPGIRAHRPTPYRYPILIERAKELTRMAAQVESSMLAAIQQGDQERYNLLKAKQDVRLAEAGVRLQELRVKEAEDGVGLADLQKAKAVFQATHYEELIEAGPTGTEQAALALLWVTAGLHTAASTLSFVALGFHLSAAGLSAGLGTGGPAAAAGQNAAAASASASATSSLAATTQTISTALSTIAAWERRLQEWEFARGMALQDIAIGDQQIKIAQDHVKVANQERQIARMQTENAQDTVDFLATKFTNIDLYDFMTDVLEGVYSFFLQHATAVAQMAYDQLAFERQQEPPQFIRADYWQTPSPDAFGASEDASGPDRRGLTGSARLLEDIVQLDEYAFETDRRKHQLTAALSLARLAPTEFVRFKQTGELRFTTTSELFDRQFPGHYLRLLKRVRTSVIALIPPATGIRATLARTGPSFTVVGGQTFQRVRIPPTGAELALSSPYDDTGVFQLDVQPEMRNVFESEGLEGGWVMRMPKPANPFDFDTIADVVFTFEYTALSSEDYRHQVILGLNPRLRAERAFSFRNDLADQWYDLRNPDETATPMKVTFRTTRNDFPSNVEDLQISSVVLLFAPREGGTFETPIPISALKLDGVGGAAVTSIQGVASSRTNAASWVQMVGKEPLGEWTLQLPENQDTRDLFDGGVIDDILLVVGFDGDTPAWV